MEKGKLLGSGVTAEAYEWGKGKILKLYFKKYSNDSFLNYEVKTGRIIHASGIISPAVYDTVEIDGRKGVIYQRISGKPMTEHLITEPWRLDHYMRQIAGLHYHIHKFTAKGLPTQKIRFMYAIKRSSHLLGRKVKNILDYVDSLPDGESVCHGDFYSNNIIVSGKKLVPIDWNTAYIGNPLSDVAVTCMIICSPAAPCIIPPAIGMLSYYPRWLAYRAYVNEYMKYSGAKYENIDAWALPVAATKLRDNIPGERKWLLNIIDRRMEKL